MESEHIDVGDDVSEEYTEPMGTPPASSKDLVEEEEKGEVEDLGDENVSPTAADMADVAEIEAEPRVEQNVVQLTQDDVSEGYTEPMLSLAPSGEEDGGDEGVLVQSADGGDEVNNVGIQIPPVPHDDDDDVSPVHQTTPHKVVEEEVGEVVSVQVAPQVASRIQPEPPVPPRRPVEQDVDEVIHNSVERVLKQSTPEFVTPLSTARDDERPQHGQTYISKRRSVWETLLDDHHQDNIATPIFSALDETQSWSCASSPCEKSVLKWRSVLLAKAEDTIRELKKMIEEKKKEIVRKEMIIAEKDETIKEKEHIILHMSKSHSNSFVSLITSGKSGKPIICGKLLAYLKPKDRMRLATCSKGTERSISRGIILSLQTKVAASDLEKTALQTKLRTSTGEVASMWSQRWNRLEEVTEKNRALRCPSKVTLPDIHKKPSRTAAPMAGEDKSSLELTEEDVSAIAMDVSTDLSSAVETTKELADFKASYASFVTSWSKAIEVAENFGDSSTEKMKENVVQLCRSPIKWSDLDWCREAVKMSRRNLYR